MLCVQDTPALLFSCMVPTETDKNCFPSSQSTSGIVIIPVATRKGFRVAEMLLVLVNYSSPKSVRHPIEHIMFCEGQGDIKAEKSRNGTYYSQGCVLKQHQNRIILKLEK